MITVGAVLAASVLAGAVHAAPVTGGAQCTGQTSYPGSFQVAIVPTGEASTSTVTKRAVDVLADGQPQVGLPFSQNYHSFLMFFNRFVSTRLLLQLHP